MSPETCASSVLILFALLVASVVGVIIMMIVSGKSHGILESANGTARYKRIKKNAAGAKHHTTGGMFGKKKVVDANNTNDAVAIPGSISEHFTFGKWIKKTAEDGYHEAKKLKNLNVNKK